MSGRYLLDTNIMSDLMRNPQGLAAQHVARVGSGAIYTSVIVTAELRFGVARKPASRLAERLTAILEHIDVFPLVQPADLAYAKIRSELESRGLVIGGNDMLIAAHAISLGDTVVTDNEKEFLRITNIKAENWLRMPLT